MTRDSQRRAVYRWEGSIVKRWPECNEKMSFSEIRSLVKRVWNDYRPGDDLPRVEFCTRSRSWATGGRFRIKIPAGRRSSWAWTPIVVLHETAHSILPGERHGPKFASLVLELWAKYAGVPEDEAKSMGTRQKPRRVQFAVAADTFRRPSAEWLEWKAMKDQAEKLLRELREAEPEKY